VGGWSERSGSTRNRFDLEVSFFSFRLVSSLSLEQKLTLPPSLLSSVTTTSSLSLITLTLRSGSFLLASPTLEVRFSPHCRVDASSIRKTQGSPQPFYLFSPWTQTRWSRRNYCQLRARRTSQVRSRRLRLSLVALELTSFLLSPFLARKLSRRLSLDDESSFSAGRLT